MAGSWAKRGLMHLRQRSTTAVVLSRADPRAGGTASAAPGATPTAPLPSGRRRAWPTVLTWILLGGAIAALWALLLLGDSLVVSG